MYWFFQQNVPLKETGRSHSEKLSSFTSEEARQCPEFLDGPLPLVWVCTEHPHYRSYSCPMEKKAVWGFVMF